MKFVGGYWWPDIDENCHPAVLRCVADLEAKWLPHIKGRQVAVQAGGNVGAYPLWLSLRFDQVYTFEADATNFECLLVNCAGVENIHSRCAALGNVEGRELAMRKKVPENVGSHYIDPRPGPDARFDVIETTIDGLKLDACDLIALDIEGYEYRALRGAEQTIAAYKPTIIWERKHGGRYGPEHLAIPEFLTARHYKHVATVERDEVWLFHSC